MKKFFRVFYSQIFNSLFPIIIVAILLRHSGNSQTASIFLLLNFSNLYLLFSDYSSNTILFKNALQSGGITNQGISGTIVKDVEAYIGVKIVILSIGFVIWVGLCLLVPQLSKHAVSNILAYSFIVGNNINFYWLYMSSDKEYFFIVSNFLGRLIFISLLLAYIFFGFDMFSLMPLAGLGIVAISLLTFKRFCTVYNLTVSISFKTLPKGMTVIKRDWPLVANSVLAMTPTTCLSLFIGFVKNSSHVLVYALAEKIFMALRAFLAMFVNSIYPVICQEGSIYTKRSKNILLTFYILVVVGCALTYLISPWIFQYLKQPALLNSLFTKCLLYFLVAIFFVSLNTRYFLHLLVTNHFNNAKSSRLLLIAALAVVATFLLNIFASKSVIAITRSVLISEMIIVLAFVIIANLTRPKVPR